ncbi:MAG: hypothetical protein ACRCXC_08630 [Legionella sp.]
MGLLKYKVSDYEIAESQTVAEANLLLETIRTPIDYTLELDSKRARKCISKKAAALSRLMKDSGDSGKALMQLSDSLSTFQDAGSETLTNGLHIGAMVFAIIEFFRIPLIYLTAYLLNEKVPINVNNNSRWLYSTFLVTTHPYRPLRDVQG